MAFSVRRHEMVEAAEDSGNSATRYLKSFTK
jgi:hypothetical protein